MKTLEQKMMTVLRTTLNNQMQSVLSRTKTIRIVKFFPKKSNQLDQRFVCYDRYGSIIFCEDFDYCSKQLLFQLLPSRIGLVEDEFYLSKKKDFDFYKN